jgi:hypothetical protein
MAIEVHIRHDEVQAALAAVAALGVPQAVAGHPIPNLVTALAALGFEADLDFPSGDIWIEVFRGRQWEDQERLFSALAPYAQGRVEVFARDGAHWGYLLRDGSLVHEKVA